MSADGQTVGFRSDEEHRAWIAAQVAKQDNVPSASPWQRHPQPASTSDERRARYDLYEDVIVKLRFDGSLTKAEQHAQVQRIWDAARTATLGLGLTP